MECPEAARIAGLLHEIDATARLIEFTETPDDVWYSARIEIPGEIAKPLVLPKSLVRGAGSDPRALRTLRNILRVEVTMQWSRKAMDRARETLAGVERDSVCPRCLTPIRLGESVRFEHGEVFHLRCETSAKGRPAEQPPGP
jgi:hypothetical protein